MKTQAGSLEMIRHLNQNLVLGIIRREEPVSRAQIAKELNLSRSTVSQIVDCLLENELIYEAGMEETSAKACGRPGQMLRYNPVSSYILGVHLTHRESRLCLADLRGNPIASSDYPPVADAEDVHAAIQDILKTSGIPQEKVSRISISVPGSVNAEGKVLRCSRLHWRNYDLKRFLSAWYASPIDINNDVNLALEGEQRFGNGRDCGSLVYLSLGKGVGCGILSNGKVVAGHSFMAGEISYFPCEGIQDENGRAMLLEQAVGLSSFGSQEAFEAAVAGYTRGEAQSVESIGRFIHMLSMTIAFITCLINPHRLIIGGRMSEAMEDLLEDIRESVAATLPIPLDIQLGSLGERACLVGALAHALNQLDGE